MQARCKIENKDPSYFFVEASEASPGRHGISIQTIENERKQYCFSCEIREECLGYALRTNQEYGIWGGTTYQDRKRIKRKDRNWQKKYSKPKNTEFIGPLEPYIPKSHRQQQAG